MTGIVILAAGASTRLGQAKQLISFQGKTLLQRTIHAALSSQGEPVVVVLGAKAEAILPETPASGVYLVENKNWQEGMGSSICTGLAKLQEVAPAATGVLFLLCDQPFVTSDLLNDMMAQKESSGKGIVACAYGETMGAPVLFDQHYFPELLHLQGQEGAKKVLKKYASDIYPIPFSAGAIDIDTPSDLDSLLTRDSIE